MPVDLAKTRQILGEHALAQDDDDAAAPIPDIPHGPAHQRFASASASDARPFARSKLAAFLDRRNQVASGASTSPRVLRHFQSASNIPYGSHQNFPLSPSSSGRASFSFPNESRSLDDSDQAASSPPHDYRPLRSLSSMTTGQPWQNHLDQSRRSHKLGLAQLVSRRKPSASSPYINHVSQPSNATSHTHSSHVSIHSLSNRGPPLVPSRLSSLTAEGNGIPDETEEETESDNPKGEVFESTVPDVAKWFDGLAEPGKGPTSRHKRSSRSQASSTRPRSSRAPSVTASNASTFLRDGNSSGSDGERTSHRRSGRRHQRRHSRSGSAYTSASSRRGSDAYSERVVVTRRTKLRDSISRQGSVLSTSDSDGSEPSRILQIHLPRASSRSSHRHNPTAELRYQRPSSRSHSTHTLDDSYESRPRTSRRDDHHEYRPRSSRRQERAEEIIEISLPREKSRHSQRSRRPSRASRWEPDADAPPIPAVIGSLAAPELDYKHISDPGPNADYRPPSRPRHKSSAQSMVAQAVEESIRKRAEADPQYLSVTPTEARLLINMRKKRLAMQKQLFSEGYRHALEEELHQLEQMQAAGKNKQARVDERSSFASMPDDVGYLGSQFPSPPNGAASSHDDRPIITDTIMESPSENDLSRSNSLNGRAAGEPAPTPMSAPTSRQTARTHSTSRPSTAKASSASLSRAEPLPSMPTVAAQAATANTDSPAAPQAARASTLVGNGSLSGAARANSLTIGALQASASRNNSMTSAAAAAAATAARTKSMTSTMAGLHGRGAGSRDLGKQQGRAVASRQPSWIRRSDEEPLAKYQSQMQQVQLAETAQQPAVQHAQEFAPAEPLAQVPSPNISVDPSWTAESPLVPDFPRTAPAHHEAEPSVEQSAVASVTPLRPDVAHHMPGSWRESGMSTMSFSQHAYTQLKSSDSRPLSEVDAEAAHFSGTVRDSGASSWVTPSLMTADNSEFSSVNGDDVSPRHTLMEDGHDRKRETAVYSPVDSTIGIHERQGSGNSFVPVPSMPSDLSRSDTVVRVHDQSIARAGMPLNYSLFPAQPKLAEPSVQSVATRRAQFEQSAAGQEQAQPQPQPELPPKTPDQKQARTAYASPAGSRSSSRASKLPRMRGSSLPTIPLQTA